MASLFFIYTCGQVISARKPAEDNYKRKYRQKPANNDTTAK